jgi:predicted O-linked N-acetylglucosamine transferase (SPINDLY family)
MNNQQEKKQLDLKVGCNGLIYGLIQQINNHIYVHNNAEARREYLKGIEIMVDMNIEEILKMSIEERNKTELGLLNYNIPLFQLAYYGENIKELGEKIIKMYRLIYGDFIDKINTQFKRDKILQNDDKRVRVLFISDRLSGVSSVIKDRGQIIKMISEDKAQFFTGIMTKPKPFDDFANQISRNVDMIHTLQDDILMNVTTIANMLYDIIVYCDCHMGVQVSALALFRLAPIQLTTFGHSESSFCLDYYVSSRLYEIEDNPQQFYTEKLLLTDCINMKYPNLEFKKDTDKMKTKLYYGFGEKTNIYLCASSLFKIGGDFIKMCSDLLEEDKNGVVVFIRMSDYYDEMFNKYLDLYVNPEVRGRIHFRDRMASALLIQLMNVSTCLLDSYPFGNLNTCMEAYLVGCPTVTLPTNKLNGRFTQAYNKILNCEELTVDSLDNLKKKALELSNVEYRSEISKRIDDNRSKLFNQDKSVENWKKILIYLKHDPEKLKEFY